MRALLIWLAVFSTALFGAELIAADPPKTAKPAKATKPPDKERALAITKIRGKNEAVRLEGVHLLAAFKDADAAKNLYQYGLHDGAESVRRAAYDVLLSFKDQPEVCAYLIDQMNYEARRPMPNQYSPLILSLLLSSNVNEVQQTSIKYVNEQLAEARGGDVFVVALIDLLGGRGDPEDVLPLERLAQSKMFEEFYVRRALIQALIRIDRVEAINALVKLLPKTEGEVRSDAIEYLTLVSNQKQLTEPEQWVTWWNENKATFKFPVPFMRPATRKFENVVGGDTALYYGLPLYGKKLVFIIDSSGSMEGERMVAAKRELINAIQGLKDDVKIGIVVFNSGVSYWKRELVPADTGNKIDAARFIQHITPASATATYDAIVAGLYFDAEAIYLLTDGAPTSGRYVLPGDIIDNVTKQNTTRRESLYTIGIAPGPPESPMENFLRTLAEKNYGLYRRVDE